MNVHALSPRLRWTAAAIGAAVVMAVLAPLFLLPRIPVIAPAVPARPAAVKLADPSPANPLVREDTVMHDLAPLFLPTERNASLGRAPRLDVGRTVLDWAPADRSLAEGDLHFERDLPPAPLLNGKAVTTAKPVDALGSPGEAAGIVSFGRSNYAVDALPARGGYVEVVAVRTGERVFGDDLDASAKPPTEKPWGPVQFLASVDASGLAGPLMLTERSGVEEVDQHFRNFLARTYRIGQRLPPGIYRVTVGP